MSCGIVGVHLGAGYHSPDRQEEYRGAINKACQEAISLLKSGGSAVDAVSVAVAALEDCPCTNAGIGSNLTLDGSIECDAGLMDGNSMHFGAVGALSGIKNPVKVAHTMVLEQQKGLLSFGRIPPCVLVGNGALQWASDHGFREVSMSSLITQRALSSYRKHKRRLAEVTCEAQSNGENVAKQARMTSMSEDAMQDTVGAVCMDSHGHTASAVSSGGIVLKHPGRIGHAVMFGCGCWAQSHRQSSMGVNAACSTSGCGEQLMRCCLARACCQAVIDGDDPSAAVSSVFQKQFLKSPLLGDDSPRLGGALTLQCGDDTSKSELLWIHSTESMCVGYMDTGLTRPKMVISRLPKGARAGKSFTLGGTVLYPGPPDPEPKPP
ncbi:threonine aspartase 1-like [Diadema antillarum]|uniref:threonine aspartase 1-like n=1 Tax=Diadema antillarum TaxID=105358 RepID=UPI003A893EE7